MKNIALALFASIFSAYANAGTMQLDLRADYNSSSYEKSAEADTAKYYFKVGRFDFQGKATEDLLFRTRFAFNKNATTAVSGRPDSTQPYVELAYLTHKLTDDFSLSVGKLRPGVGGFEGDASSAEHYLTSVTYSRKGANGDLTSNLYGTADVLYMTGVKLTYNQGPHSFDLVATDEPDSAKSGPVATHNTALLGALWKGSFMEKVLAVNVSYHTVNGAAKDDKFQLMAAGLQWTSSPFIAVVDYLYNDFSQDGTGNKDTLTTLIGKLTYTGFEQWTPRLEMTYSEEKIEVGSNTKNRFNGAGVVLEYKPIADTNFRYHFAYSGTNMETEAGKTINKQEVVVGVRLLADFLK